jgi:hypothetical protein
MKCLLWDIQDNQIWLYIWGRRGRDRMAVGFTSASYAISAYQFEFRSCVVYLIQHYAIQFVSDFRHVGGFLHQ